MKLGISSYSLLSKLKLGEMTILDTIEWTALNGGEHVEIVPIGFEMDQRKAKAIAVKAKEVGIEISNYAIGADFLQNERTKEIERVKKQVDLAAELGVKLMRHDVAIRLPSECGILQFEEDLPKLAEACADVAEYAEQFGITTSVENHGFYVQAADRVQRLLDTVGKDNFKTTLDTGNFLCVDEDPLVSVAKNIPYASMVHFKDFYIRSGDRTLGEGWMKTANGNYLRGAIIGHGDIDIRKVIQVVQNAGYDGYVSVEFEGMEDSEKGSRISLDNLRNMWMKAMEERV